MSGGSKSNSLKLIHMKDLESRKVVKRVKVFLSKSRSKAGLERLSARIAELETLSRQCHRLAPERTTRRTKGISMETYSKVRKCAISLHSALSQGWHCKCEIPHLANLRLEARKAPQPKWKARRGSTEEDVRFKFLFSFTAEGADDKTAPTGTSRDHPPGAQWREVELAPLDPGFANDVLDRAATQPRKQSIKQHGSRDSQDVTLLSSE